MEFAPARQCENWPPMGSLPGPGRGGGRGGIGVKVLMGGVAGAGGLATATANAQGPAPYRIGGPVVIASDFVGPYAAMPPRYAPMVLPPREVYAIVRENGFSPLGAPQQRGAVYTISAIDPDGEDGRL